MRTRPWIVSLLLAACAEGTEREAEPATSSEQGADTTLQRVFVTSTNSSNTRFVLCMAQPWSGGGSPWNEEGTTVDIAGESIRLREWHRVSDAVMHWSDHLDAEKASRAGL